MLTQGTREQEQIFKVSVARSKKLLLIISPQLSSGFPTWQGFLLASEGCLWIESATAMDCVVYLFKMEWNQGRRGLFQSWGDRWLQTQMFLQLLHFGPKDFRNICSPSVLSTYKNCLFHLKIKMDPASGLMLLVKDFREAARLEPEQRTRDQKKLWK